MRDKVSVIIPVFNEEGAIKEVVDGIKRVLGSQNHEIVVVNDGSTDSSLKILKGMKCIKIVNSAYNLGYGASIKKGIKNSDGEWILIIDADGTYPIEVIPRLLDYCGEYDMVVGARLGPEVEIPLARKPAKWFLGKLANFLSGQKIPDLNSGLRVFRREIANDFFHLFPKGFSFTTTITLACHTKEYTVKYVPINYYKRQGKSTIKPVKDFFNFISLIIRMVTYFKPLKIFFSVSLLLFLAALSIFIYSFFALGRIMDVTVIILGVASLQIFLFGLLAELMVKRAER